MGNETEEREIEEGDSETEGVESENEGVYNEVLPPEKKYIAYGILPLSTTMM